MFPCAAIASSASGNALVVIVSAMLVLADLFATTLPEVPIFVMPAVVLRMGSTLVVLLAVDPAVGVVVAVMIVDAVVVIAGFVVVVVMAGFVVAAGAAAAVAASAAAVAVTVVTLEIVVVVVIARFVVVVVLVSVAWAVSQSTLRITWVVLRSTSKLMEELSLLALVDMLLHSNWAIAGLIVVVVVVVVM